jgi:peptidoglycan/xylan/chitin deacetylase (PgdA/CDA1 family)
VPTPAQLPAPIAYATLLARPDDTLAAIAERMGSDASAIVSLNHLDASAALRPDRPLVIPVYRAAEPGVGSLVIRRANPAARNVALTFDIEIDAATLYGFLDVLRQRGIHGTFFVTGRWVMAFPDAARAIVSDGHEIGNHSLTHPSFARIGLDGAASEIEQTERIISEVTGVSSRPYFRFPYGDATAATADIVAREGFVAYHWSADDGAIPGWLDWAGQHPDEANGAILLLHGRASSVAALPGWLDRLAALGLQPTTLGAALR